MKKVIYAIKGMHCASCAQKIEKSLKKTDGVSDAFVNIASEKASVQFDESKVNEERLAQAIRETGYDIYE